jgi:hypothetical protein
MNTDPNNIGGLTAEDMLAILRKKKPIKSYSFGNEDEGSFTVNKYGPIENRFPTITTLSDLFRMIGRR